MAGTHYLELAKIRLTAMVLVSTAVGYVMASIGPMDWARLLVTVLGSGLAAVGAGTFNQLLEIDRDARMERTRFRPLPSGKISPGHAFVFAVVTTAIGLGILYQWVNMLTALLGLANVLIYTLIYTPLKIKTPLCTLIGAICGALPPMMGCTAATNRLGIEALVLGAILFAWQVPHFLALVWLYRDDYSNAGYRILPVVDVGGRITCLAIILFSLALLPLGLAATWCGMTGNFFGAVSLAMGLGLLTLALQLRADKTRRNARRMFLATIAYLPLLLLLMVADAPSHRRISAEQAALLPAEASAKP
jgi:heme o synthase